MPKASKEKVFSKAVTAPKENANELTAWWGRTLSMGYHGYKVKVTHRKRDASVDELGFVLVGENNPPPTEFIVDLREQSDAVWPELPSTAQLVENVGPGEANFGFLFLEEKWAKKQNIDPALHAEGGGKYPFSAGAYFAPALAAALSKVNEPKLRDELKRVFDTVVEKL